MEKYEIIECSKLKAILNEKHPQLDLSTLYEYGLNKKTHNLTIRLSHKCLKANMQSNEAAFDSWAIVLKYYLSDIVDTVTIEWDDNIEKPNEGYQHFNRFVYRLTKFAQTYDWVKVGGKLPSLPSMLKCNFPLQNAADSDRHKDDSEGRLECEFVENNKKTYDYIDHQLPVGLFDQKKSNKTFYTTGQNSAIDIWAVKGNVFSIFELKKPENKPLGIISEIMFYTNVVNDLFTHRIQYDDTKELQNTLKNNYRGFRHFYDLYLSGKITKINAIMLADDFHTAITPGLIEFINDSPRLKYYRIELETQKL